MEMNNAMMVEEEEEVTLLDFVQPGSRASPPTHQVNDGDLEMIGQEMGMGSQVDDMPLTQAPLGSLPDLDSQNTFGYQSNPDTHPGLRNQAAASASVSAPNGSQPSIPLTVSMSQVTSKPADPTREEDDDVQVVVTTQTTTTRDNLGEGSSSLDLHPASGVQQDSNVPPTSSSADLPFVPNGQASMETNTTSSAESAGVKAEDSARFASSSQIQLPPAQLILTQRSDSFPQTPHVLPSLLEYEKTPAKTGYVYDTRMMDHYELGWTGDPENDDLSSDEESDDDKDYSVPRRPHPEDPRRILAIFETIKRAGLIDSMVELPCTQATRAEVALIHDDSVWRKTEATKLMTVEDIKETKALFEYISLYVNNHTAMAARLSCGGVISACKAVAMGVVRNAIAIVRPPGHHAEPVQSMGFCLYNNVAVATRVLQQEMGVKKILILDWDVHHGNGTQSAFFEDPNVLFISIHRHDGGTFYPAGDAGALNVVGSNAGVGRGGFGDADYIYAFQRIVMPVAYEFGPDIVLVSAGFDAARGDELGGCDVTPVGYAHMTHMLSSLAGGKMVVALEGGYNRDAIARSALAVNKVLMGERPPEMGPMQASDEATEVVFQVAKVHGHYWKSIDVQGCEPISSFENIPKDDIYDIAELIKAKRADRLYTEHRLFRITLSDEQLQSEYPDQVLASGDLFDRSRIVLYVHDFGNLQVETGSAMYNEVDLTASRMIDTSSGIVQWSRRNGLSLVDVNVLRPLALEYDRTTALLNKSTPARSKGYAALLRHIWQNYLFAAAPTAKIIMIGYGTGCDAIMSLINDPDVNIEERVAAVVQVGGMHSLVRPDPDLDQRRGWYRRHSRLYVSDLHPITRDERMMKRLGTVVVPLGETLKVRVLIGLGDIGTAHQSILTAFLAETKPIEVLQKAMPLIQKYLEETSLDGSATQKAAAATTTATRNGVTA